MEAKSKEIEAQNIDLVKQGFVYRNKIDGLEKANVTLCSQYDMKIRFLETQLHQMRNAHVQAQAQSQQKQMATQGMPIMIPHPPAYTRPMMIPTGPSVFIPGATSHATMLNRQQLQQQAHQQLQQQQHIQQQHNQHNQQQQRGQNQNGNHNNRGRESNGRHNNYKNSNNKRHKRSGRRSHNKGRNRTKSQSSFSADIRIRNQLFDQDLPPIPVSADHEYIPEPIPPTHSKNKVEKKDDNNNVKEPTKKTTMKTTTTINKDLNAAEVNLPFAPIGNKDEIENNRNSSQCVDFTEENLKIDENFLTDLTDERRAG